MNNAKTGSYGKLIAFFLVAVIVLCAFGFAVEGWQTRKNTQDTNTGTDNTLENIPTGGNGDDTIPPTSEPELPSYPKYTNYITGLEISADESNLMHLCFSLDSLAPLYGICAAEMLIEIPIENSTRFLAFIKDVESIGKIGSIAPSRAYISSLAQTFSSILISSGNDDTASYPSTNTGGSHFDLEKNTGYSYTEYSKYNYSNGQLINAGLTNTGINMIRPITHAMPYIFNDFSSETIKGDLPVQIVSLPFGDRINTKLSYSSQSGTYIFSKNDTTKLDTLADSSLEFTNVFVLFADSVTYEGEAGTETVINTSGSGKGIYITSGTAKNISWASDTTGSMTFFDADGNILKVNRGTSYIGFVKSSKIDDVKFS